MTFMANSRFCILFFSLYSNRKKLCRANIHFLTSTCNHFKIGQNSVPFTLNVTLNLSYGKFSYAQVWPTLGNVETPRNVDTDKGRGRICIEQNVDNLLVTLLGPVFTANKCARFPAKNTRPLSRFSPNEKQVSGPKI